MPPTLQTALENRLSLNLLEKVLKLSYWKDGKEAASLPGGDRLWLSGLVTIVHSI